LLTPLDPELSLSLRGALSAIVLAALDSVDLLTPLDPELSLRGPPSALELAAPGSELCPPCPLKSIEPLRNGVLTHFDGGFCVLGLLSFHELPALNHEPGFFGSSLAA